MVLLTKTLARAIYGVYAWSACVVLTGLTLIAVLLLPSLASRRMLAHKSARLLLRAVGMPVECRDLHLVPGTPCVVVANHSSYLDGVVLKAALPARFSFVIKKELVRVPLAGLFLRRIGAEFVDRFNRHSGGMDARRLMRTAAQGQSLVFFPEGTFTGRPGLARFHTGAFVTAARASLPVVPVVIRGARRALRLGNPWPRPGRIQVQALPPLEPPMAAADAKAVAQLRDQARARILVALGEPDLSTEEQVAELPTVRSRQA